MTLNLLYLANNHEVDMMIFKEVVPFFSSTFQKYEELNDNVKRIFRDLVYEQCKELDCSREEFFILYEFLNYNKVQFLPLYRRFIYRHRDDKEFVKATAYIHRMHRYLGVDILQFYYIILGKSNIDEIIELSKSGNPDAKFAHIYFLEFNEELDTKDIKKLYFENWTENKHSDSLHRYAYLSSLSRKTSETARDLFKLNWDQYGNSDSLHKYAECLLKGYGGKYDIHKAVELFKLNWEENKNSVSLTEYADCLSRGVGCSINKTEAIRLFKLNWEDNNSRCSLHRYASFLQYGSGERDEKEARRLYKLNWQQNKYKSSLESYTDCLIRGIGGPVDLEEAKRYGKILSNIEDSCIDYDTRDL